MARKKGPKMIDELVRRRARGDGLKTIALDLKIARNTVKTRLREVGCYEVADALRASLSGFALVKTTVFSPHWSSDVTWETAISEVVGGCTIKEFWEEYLVSGEMHDLRNVPYETFWREFRRRYPEINVHYHKQHDPGLRCEIDFKGDDGFGYTDKSTGEFITCRLFGIVLCNSRLFFPYATLDEKQQSWFAGIREGFSYFGGVTEVLVVDNSRCAVNEADWFDPDLNQEFYNFCGHYGTSVVAARPRRPKDKNLIEVHLGVFWRWVRRKLRARQFFSLGEINQFLTERANEFNNRYQRKYGSSRRERFEKQEKETLKPLPLNQFEAGEWRKAKLHEDCHVQFKYNFYSAPFQHRGKELDVRVTQTHVEIFFQQERIALHQRRPDCQRGYYSTDKKHLPEKHQAMEELSVSRQIKEAERIGPHIGEVITTLLTDVSHPLVFLRRTMGILRLKGRYGATRLDRACEILIQHGRTKPRVKDVERMLQSPNLDNKPMAIPIERKPNPHLHGQVSFTTEGENTYESIPQSN